MLRVNRIESSRWRLYQNGLTKNELEQKARSVRGPAVLPSRALLGYAAINTASAGPPNYQPLHPAPRAPRTLPHPRPHPRSSLARGNISPARPHRFCPI